MLNGKNNFFIPRVKVAGINFERPVCLCSLFPNYHNQTTFCFDMDSDYCSTIYTW